MLILGLIASSTALLIAAGTAAVGGVVSAVGAVQQGRAAKKMANYNAQLATNNAKIQENNALASQRQAMVEADRKRRMGKILSGRIKSSVSKSGTTFDGSVQDILLDNAINVEIDALTELYKGTADSQNFRNSASDSLAQASMSRMQGKAAQSSSYYQAAGSVLSGAGNAASYYGQSKNPSFS